jgi:glutamine amidotransferase PdxT
MDPLLAIEKRCIALVEAFQQFGDPCIAGCAGLVLHAYQTNNR